MTEAHAAEFEPMPPGYELDALVGVVLGWRRNFDIPAAWIDPAGKIYEDIFNQYPVRLPKFSQFIDHAWIAWEWLEQNHPWEAYDNIISLCRIDGPSVVVWGEDGYDKCITGQTYPHAIALAVVEVGRLKGLIE